MAKASISFNLDDEEDAERMRIALASKIYKESLEFLESNMESTIIGCIKSIKDDKFTKEYVLKKVSEQIEILINKVNTDIDEGKDIFG